MRIIGRRREHPITFAASGRLYIKRARSHEGFQKLPMGLFTAIPKGVRFFSSHEEANRYDDECIAARLARLSERRS